MPTFDIKMSDPRLPLGGLDHQTISRVWVAAANKTLAKAKTAAVRTITQHYTIKRVELVGKKKDKVVTKKGTVFIRRATPARPEAIIGAAGRPMALSKFKHKKKAKGVHVQVKKKGAGGLLEGRFVATMPSGHVGIFIRPKHATWRSSEKKTLPINEEYGPGAPTMLESVAVRRRVAEVIKEDSARLFLNQMDRELRRRRR